MLSSLLIWKRKDSEYGSTRAAKSRRNFELEPPILKTLIPDDGGSVDHPLRCVHRNILWSPTASLCEDGSKYAENHRSLPPPPPLPMLARTGEQRCYMPWELRCHRNGSRLVIKEIRAEHHDYFRTSREDGRLSLQLISADEASPVFTRNMRSTESETTEEEIDHANDGDVTSTESETDEKLAIRRRRSGKKKIKEEKSGRGELAFPGLYDMLCNSKTEEQIRADLRQTLYSSALMPQSAAIPELGNTSNPLPELPSTEYSSTVEPKIPKLGDTFSSPAAEPAVQEPSNTSCSSPTSQSGFPEIAAHAA